MKNLKRTLITVVAMLLVCVISVAATLAYLYDASEKVVNAFTIGKVDISLDEAEVNINGQLLDVDGNVWDPEDAVPKADRVFGNEYKLIPNRTYVKDPIVHVSEDSEPCILYVLIYVPNAINDVILFTSEATDPNDLGKQIVDNGWKYSTAEFKRDADGKEVGKYYWYFYSDENWDPKTVFGGENIPIFESITVKETSTYEQLVKANSCQMEITAFALQAEERSISLYQVRELFKEAFDPFGTKNQSN
jgi:predicted ribosomally synthesized peptide with SipW-like signal peptide